MRNIEQNIFIIIIMCMKKQYHFKGVYQKVKVIKELYLYNQYYSSFSKGKQGEINTQDDNSTSFIYSISKSFLKNLFLITKYAYIFMLVKITQKLLNLLYCF